MQSELKASAVTHTNGEPPTRTCIIYYFLLLAGHKLGFISPCGANKSIFWPPSRKKIVCDTGKTFIFLVWLLPSLCSGIKLHTRTINFFSPSCTIYYLQHFTGSLHLAHRKMCAKKVCRNQYSRILKSPELSWFPHTINVIGNLPFCEHFSVRKVKTSRTVLQTNYCISLKQILFD